MEMLYGLRRVLYQNLMKTHFICKFLKKSRYCSEDTTIGDSGLVLIPSACVCEEAAGLTATKFCTEYNDNTTCLFKQNIHLLISGLRRFSHADTTLRVVNALLWDILFQLVECLKTILTFSSSDNRRNF